MTLGLRELLLISRPRFWLYTLGPASIAWIAGFATKYDGFYAIRDGVELAYSDNNLLWYTLLVIFCFLIPANVIIYGVNDICDYETDLINDKKGTYELKMNKDSLDHIFYFIVLNSVFFVSLGWYTYILGLLEIQSILLVIGGFFFFSIFYSAKPIRAKAIPFLDGIFNILYLFSVPFGRIISGQHLHSLDITIFIASILFMMAWHTFSAIPDIVPDTKTGITTTAVFLGEKKTLIYCCTLRFIAAVLLYPFLGRRILPLLITFCGLCIVSFFIPIFTVYKVIPYLIPFIGTFYFWVILLRG